MTDLAYQRLFKNAFMKEQDKKEEIASLKTSVDYVCYNNEIFKITKYIQEHVTGVKPNTIKKQQLRLRINLFNIDKKEEIFYEGQRSFLDEVLIEYNQNNHVINPASKIYM